MADLPFAAPLEWANLASLGHGQNGEAFFTLRDHSVRPFLNCRQQKLFIFSLMLPKTFPIVFQKHRFALRLVGINQTTAVMTIDCGPLSCVAGGLQGRIPQPGSHVPPRLK